MSRKYSIERLDRDEVACLLVDHQTGLFSLARDYEPTQFKNNVLATAALAKFFKLPTLLTASLESGPNGPLLPEIRKMHPDAPLVPRGGEINAWDSEEFVEAVKRLGKKQLLVSGIVTDVCVSFVTLSALEAGYSVFVVTDASGTFNEATRHAAWMRMAAAGADLVNWFAVACELHRDWRNDLEGLGALCAAYIPDYANLMTSNSHRQQ